MSEKDRNDAVDKIIGNMSAEMQNTDGQYSLGFSTPPSEHLNWTQPPYCFYHSTESYAPSYGASFGYGPPYEMKYVYERIPSSDFRNDFMEQPQASGQLIKNFVGNWVPTSNGTYSPFGNVEPFKGFEQGLESQNVREGKPLDVRTKKPRIVAEVKPMRPSYSDVLTKAVLTKPKNEIKEVKQKKESNKKSNKTEKTLKIGNTLTRSNTNTEIKDLPLNEKNSYLNKSNDKEKRPKTTQLNRKWASLDNINEPTNSVKEDVKKKKNDSVTQDNKNLMAAKSNLKKVSKNNGENLENEQNAGKNDSFNGKNGLRKINKINNNKTKNIEANSTNNERSTGKRNYRVRKRDNNLFYGIAGEKIKEHIKGWWKIFTVFLLWFIHLISDICSLSVQISRDMALNFYLWSVTNWALFVDTLITIAKRIRLLTWIYEKFQKSSEKSPKHEPNRNFLHGGLQNNINMPTTGDEAMKRLLACKGKDPYSILGVTPSCTDDDIKRYYKRQAFLVHPDKNQQPGAEEAFKILVHAFDMIGEPERRAAYDKGVVESVQVEQAWTELTELLAQLQQKVEAAANTIRCSACNQRHKRIKVDRPSYAARNCTSCKIHHSAREGDIWAEARCFGLLWHYYACMEGSVYDITDWAGCQKDSLKHLKPDAHQVQYRIALGKQTQARRSSGTQKNEKPPDLENLLNTLYGQSEGGKKKSKKGK